MVISGVRTSRVQGTPKHLLAVDEVDAEPVRENEKIRVDSFDSK